MTDDRPPIHIGGSVSGQVAYGTFNYLTQVQGGTVNQIIVPEPVKPRLRPVDVRPGRPEGLIGRRATIDVITSALGLGPNQVYAGDGWGKTSLVEAVAYEPAAERMTDGIVFISGWGRPVEDLEQELFEAYYESALPQMGLKATPGQLRASFSDIRALIVVDDLDLPRQEVERLINAGPQCSFVTSAAEQSLWKGEAIELQGLNVAHAVELFQARLGRALGNGERAAVEGFAVGVAGFPMAMVMAAGAVRRGLGLDALAGLADSQIPTDSLLEEISNRLTVAERRALVALRSVEEAPLPTEAVGAITGLGDAQAVLDTLKSDGVLQAASPRYRLPAATAAGLGISAQPAETIPRLGEWARAVDDPESIAATGPALVAAARSANRRGDHRLTIGLARSADAGLAVSRRWGLWSLLLGEAQQAVASASSDFDTAWVLHQQGTRALLEGDQAGAREALTAARDLRVEIGDAEGLRATEHNLSQIGGAPVAIQEQPKVEPAGPDPAASGTSRVLWWLLGFVVVAVGVGIWWFNRPPDDPPPPVESTLESATERVDFGQVLIGETSEVSFSVSNTGPGTLDVLVVEVDGPFDVDHGCGQLEALESCDITVIFRSETEGSAGGGVDVIHTGSNNPLTVPLSAAALVPPSSFLGVEVPLIDFGQLALGSADRREIFVINQGETGVDVSSIEIEDGTLFGFDHNCGRVEPEESCSVVVSFRSEEPGGPFVDRLIVNHTAENDRLEVELVASVVAPPDLVVQISDSGEARGIIFENDFFGWFAVPVTIAVANAGGEPMEGAFRVHFESVDDGEAWIPIGVLEDTPEQVWFEDFLEPGDTREYELFVMFSVEQWEIGFPALLRVKVDSCFAEEFVEDPPCRIAEVDEDNNYSEPAVVPVDVDVIG